MQFHIKLHAFHYYGQTEFQQIECEDGLQLLVGAIYWTMCSMLYSSFESDTRGTGRAYDEADGPGKRRRRACNFAPDSVALAYDWRCSPDTLPGPWLTTGTSTLTNFASVQGSSVVFT